MTLLSPQLDVDHSGWCLQAIRMPSPNFDARPSASQPELLVIHNISLPPGEYGGAYIGELFTNKLNFDAHPYFDQLRNLRVSAHFLIRRDGELVQFVSVNERAWHAGVSSFRGRERCNDFSIGVELEGTDADAFTPAQYTMLVALTAALQRRYPLTDVTGHEQIAPVRKTDPGPHFDWSLYREALSKQQPDRLLALRFPGDPSV